MAYEVKAGTASMFKNEKKEKETQPDYTGSGKDLNGNDIQLSAWIKTAKSGIKYFSIAIQEKKIAKSAPAEAKTVDDNEGDLPF